MAANGVKIDITPDEAREYIAQMKNIYNELDAAEQKVNDAAVDKSVWEGSAQAAYDEKREAMISDITALREKIQKTESDLNTVLDLVVNTDGSVSMQGQKIVEATEAGTSAKGKWANK